ncbi:hypothetical protein NMY3_01238 [Candidatus Nitrosocosmicus oleophilus]|uniref:Uncharacterized protein n=1 Tax=Candidatus Nitrosocosmicus oleophilus TaxID=1353260 RepID=A0A654M7B2_9ARCH|nr:hypothetical protein NMY3_01238 [Candidatus Nitrosocosmicus oleophilus]
MVTKTLVTVTDLDKKHPDKPTYNRSYVLAKHTYQEIGDIVTEGLLLIKMFFK